jgi:uncharacterized membrane protein YqjE
MCKHTHINTYTQRDPLVALIEATKPSEAMEERLRLAQLKNEELEKELEQCRQESVLALRSLKQQFHQLQVIVMQLHFLIVYVLRSVYRYKICIPTIPILPCIAQ